MIVTTNKYSKSQDTVVKHLCPVLTCNQPAPFLASSLRTTYFSILRGQHLLKKSNETTKNQLPSR